MTEREQTLEMGGMPRREIVNYFESMDGATLISAGQYQGLEWMVEIGEEQYRTLGVIKIHKTNVTFRGSEKSIDKMIKEFRLKFLSAGG